MPSARRFALLCLVLVSSGCGLISFDISSSLPAATINSASTGTTLETLEQPVTVDKQDTGPADSAELKSLTFTATSAGSFDFLQTVHIFLDSDGLPEVEVANLLSVAPGQTTISLTAVPNVNLLPYVQAGFTLRTTVTGTHPAEDFTFNGELVAHIGI